MNRLLKMIFPCLVMLSNCSALARPGFADEPSKEPSKSSPVPSGLAALASEVIDTILEHHFDPPARQQMILTGIKAIYTATGTNVPVGLSRRVSVVTTTEALATLLEESWADTTGKSANPEELKRAFLDGLLRSVSGEPQLVPEKEQKVQEQSEGNRYVGIHVALRWDAATKRPVVSDVFEGGPADRAGVKPEDVVEQVEGVDTQGKTLRDVIDRLRGDEGTSVTIKVRQADATALRTYTIVRGQHPRPSIKGWRKRANGDWNFRMIDSKPIAFVQIGELVGSTPHELRKVAKQLESEGMKAIVFDLRGLRSNSTHTALLLADYLLDQGTIGRVRTNKGTTTYRADADALFRGWPLALLVDSQTSGAVEWLAAACQDNHRAIVIGSPTRSARLTWGNAIVNSSLPVGGGEWRLCLRREFSSAATASRCRFSSE